VGGNLGALKQLEGFKPIQSCDELEALAGRADRDGVYEPACRDLIAQPADGGGVGFEPSVSGVVEVDQVDSDHHDERCVIAVV